MRKLNWPIIWVIIYGILFWVVVVGLVVWGVAGCNSSKVVTPKWTVTLDRLLTSTQFDKANIDIEPNNSIHVVFERYKSDSQRAVDLAETALKFGIGGTVAGTALAK